MWLRRKKDPESVLEVLIELESLCDRLTKLAQVKDKAIKKRAEQMATMESRQEHDVGEKARALSVRSKIMGLIST